MQRFRPKSKDAAAAAIMDEIVSQALAGYAAAATDLILSGAEDHPDAARATTAAPGVAPLCCTAVEDFSVVDLRFKA